MANYYGQARSNYFAVKDPEAFTTEMQKYPVKLITQETDGKTLYGFLDKDDDGGANIWSYYGETEDGDGDYQDIEWTEVFKRHLVDGWVAILMESGAEKYRYIGGLASAYNNKGEVKTIMLYDIYELAKGLGEHITEATY
jgi:hypothetical protein